MTARLSRAGWLLVPLVLASAVGQEQAAEERTWRAYLRGFLSEQYIEEHLRVYDIYRAPTGLVTLRHLIRYGDITVHTRTTTPSDSGPVSGIMRISETGDVQNYFGPLKEYQLKVSRQQAVSIMAAQGCLLPPDADSENQHDSPAVRLFIGDYWDKQGKYARDYIPEGFYWVGGRPPEGQRGTECLVDAESGDFRIKNPGPH